ncbi:MAG: hypothetical protein KGO51_02805 [Alphaproteobacteria bacterium]|nr:hypothetical protein [Alphaproteobacteria bacterium]
MVGERARCIVNADLDTHPVVEIKGDGAKGLHASFPRQPGRAPKPLSDAFEPDDRALIIYCGKTAWNAAHLAKLVPVILEAGSPTLARVVTLAGEPASGLKVQLLDGHAGSKRL